jgi:hypothetical protein
MVRISAKDTQLAGRSFRPAQTLEEMMKKQKPIVLDRTEIRKSVRKPMPKPAQTHQDKREKLRKRDPEFSPRPEDAAPEDE